MVKTIGGYHGHVDGLLVEAGSGALTLGTPSTPGVPKSVAAATALVPYNDLAAAAAVLDEHAGQIACFAVEPVAGNMGVVPPAAGYLAGLRSLCDRHGVMLLFDEVMSGFRVAWGGAQVLYDVKPDLTCLGKVIGGGLPVGAYGGSRHLMERVSPAGPVYQAGTLSGNPLAMSGGLATLELLKEPGAYETLERRSASLAHGLLSAAASAKVPVAVNRVGSMVGLFFVHKRRRQGRRLRHRHRRRHPPRTPRSSTPCSTPASTSPPACTRRCSSASPTPATRSTRPSPRPKGRSGPFGRRGGEQRGRGAEERRSGGFFLVRLRRGEKILCPSAPLPLCPSAPLPLCPSAPLPRPLYFRPP